nr:immunoglobulin light chain junction region [Macaca mulatta]MPN97324.1 immunoglobulin light chain junction region [Macaca mulatta]MPN98908.1 immunoglobulin light chain junction region [Macaca mulatta]MPO00512.1 immunoglobulin light chain junction region [Macaca mulatta]MPO02637.1 immunoglobulin light chain junction region [Macaca mulatta]
CQQESNGPTF